MRKHTVKWTENHSVEVEASNLAEAKRIVNDMTIKELWENPTYFVEISGLPKDTSKK